MIRHLALLLALAASPAGAAPSVSESVVYYTVSGDTLAALSQDLKRNGPRGFWGNTRWWIKWSANCDVDLEITITLPQLDSSATLSARDKRTWDAMIEALMRHEQIHAKHGRSAAAEIFDTQCAAPRDVITKWTVRDRILDFYTRHGTTQGVTLTD